jgi:hypothetical protein
MRRVGDTRRSRVKGPTVADLPPVRGCLTRVLGGCSLGDAMPNVDSPPPLSCSRSGTCRLLADGSVAVPPSVAGRLSRPLERALREAERQGVQLYPDVVEAARLFAVAGQGAAEAKAGVRARDRTETGCTRRCPIDPSLTSAAGRASRKVRVTVDLPESLHRRLRVRVAETRTDAQTLIRALLTAELEDD